MQYDAASVARLGRPATAWADPELVAVAPAHAVLAAQPFAAAQHAVEALAHHPPGRPARHSHTGWCPGWRRRRGRSAARRPGSRRSTCRRREPATPARSSHLGWRGAGLSTPRAGPRARCAPSASARSVGGASAAPALQSTPALRFAAAGRRPARALAGPSRTACQCARRPARPAARRRRSGWPAKRRFCRASLTTNGISC